MNKGHCTRTVSKCVIQGISWVQTADPNNEYYVHVHITIFTADVPIRDKLFYHNNGIHIFIKVR